MLQQSVQQAGGRVWWWWAFGGCRLCGQHQDDVCTPATAAGYKSQLKLLGEGRRVGQDEGRGIGEQAKKKKKKGRHAFRGNSKGRGRESRWAPKVVSIINGSVMYGERDLMWPSRLRCMYNQQRQILSLCLLKSLFPPHCVHPLSVSSSPSLCSCVADKQAMDWPNIIFIKKNIKGRTCISWRRLFYEGIRGDGDK